MVFVFLYRILPRVGRCDLVDMNLGRLIQSKPLPAWLSLQVCRPYLTLGCSNNYYNHRNAATATVQVMHIVHSDR